MSNNKAINLDNLSVFKSEINKELIKKVDKTEVPTTLPANGGNSSTVNGHTVNSDVPANAKFTDTTYSTATTSAVGLMSTSDKTKLDGIAEGAQVNTVTGVKGNSESSYQTGNVNLTAANVGALPISGGTISGNLTVTGTITGSKVYNAVWNADYAEGFDYEGNRPKLGEIVELCGNNKVRMACAGSDMVIGVCSNTYWALAGCGIDEIKSGAKVAVGIMGQLPIKVRGAVKYGDYIVCAGDGIGEASTAPSLGKVVGRAMESNASAEVKNVNCIIRAL